MLNGQRRDSAQLSAGQEQSHSTAPTIALPKGGGAIRGMGEKFAANPVTGTGSMTVPIATSPGRTGFGPQLSLSYDSGAGNGSFGFGWNLALPAITRKTDKGLPQYLDAVESDVFILSGAEDLVPVLMPNGSRFEDTTTAPDYTIHRYRPRIEGLFARIERWTHRSDGDVHWRSISRDNILTIYGKDENSRIADPADPKRVFTWLICETRDDKGNAVLYKYKPEDGAGANLTQTHERNRGDRNDTRRAANRYPKRIQYGNHTPLLDNAGQRPRFLTEAQIQNAGWMFEVVFDYGEHDADAPKPDDAGQWTYRDDPFSSYRAGFEIRTSRLCQRVLMYHHFADEPGVGNGCLVRSTDFTYSHEQDPTNARNPVYTFLRAVTQVGYKRDAGGYLKRSLPAVEFGYTQPTVQDTVEEVDPASLDNLPIGLDGASYQWTDLHGEGIPGILTEQGEAWFYKRNLSPISERPVAFAPLERVAVKPNLALAGGQAQFMDLAGDGQSDLVVLDGPMPGLYEHDGGEGWQPFRPLPSPLNRDMRDPNLKFVDVDGDGHADVLISEDGAFVWHASLGEEGFGPAHRIHQTLDEEKGPRLVFADGTQSIYLADLSGDGLTDLVRIRNGEVCYWPNLGYGRFGAKVTMDNAPWFDAPGQFDHRRIRLADIDGTGTTDLIYLHRDGIRLYFNQSGNSWSAPQVLHIFPRVDDLVSIVPTDLLGNGTACLVWSSPLPGDARRPMRYVNLMGGQKPHLLVKTVNNLGAETRVQYAPSTKFYLRDKYDGKSWITRLPFPVHVVERVETHDHISGNRFITRYAYHHGYFDGEEREFRGFGMVEQWDTEEFAALTGAGTLPEATNLNAASHVPPVLTKTWFHTGIYVGRDHVSDFFAGLLDAHNRGEYYREPAWRDDDAEARERLLPDTIMPPGLTVEEEREACRALKGMMLRQEVYALDGTGTENDPYGHPYTITEQNFTLRVLQARGNCRHAVFFTHPREAINYHYERNLADPRIQHALTLEVDDFGNMLKEVAIGYGRRETIRVVDHLGMIAEIPNPGLNELGPDDPKKQTRPLITYSENRLAKDPITGVIDTAHDYRTPLPCETRTYELTGFQPENNAARFSFDEWTRNGFALPASAEEIPYERAADHVTKQKRLIEHVRTLYRKDDLTALLPLGELGPLALLGESYKLAFTPGLLAQVFWREGQPLLPNPAAVLGGQGADRGGYVVSQDLKAAGAFPNTDPDDHWWIPAGRVFFSPDSNAPAVQERAYARSHFFLPHRYRDPFHTDAVSTESFISYDAYDLLMLETRDALDNLIIAENDYRVLQPWRVMDPNHNRTQVAFDALGMVVGTAVMGKPEENLGDSPDGFVADLTEAIILDRLTNPLAAPHAILGHATTWLVYDLFAYQRTKDQPEPQPAVVYTLARETHDADLEPGQQTKIQHSFSYSDGFGREIQQKIQAELGPVPRRDAAGKIIVGADGRPEMTADDATPRWVGSGWTVYNNKGKPVRQFEPFFTDTHRFEFDVRIGVSPVIFYDPVERVVATLHPNHTYEKVIFDPWRQETWDVNDTVLLDPRIDDDIKGFTEQYFAGLATAPGGWQTWYTTRISGALGQQEQAAARKTALHANTPTAAYFDTLGRPFLTLAHNGFRPDGTPVQYQTRVHLDIEGNQREVRDAIEQNSDAMGRVVMRYDYDLLGGRVHQASMEAGERWILNDVAGNPIRAWDSRGHHFRTEYDRLRRPVRRYVRGTDANRSDPRTLNQDMLFEQIEYGEGQANDVGLNLRTRVFRQRDGAGMVTNMGQNPVTDRDEAYDFKGNLQRSSRQLVQDYMTLPDWAAPPQMDANIYRSSTTYDALNRPITLTTPDNSVIRPAYNEANLLERVEANLRGAAVATLFVADIDYDAKGQRTQIEYGSGATADRRGVTTTYTYDPFTFRLVHLLTRRNPLLFPSDCPPPPSAGCQVQNLRYTYDPAGNITHIQDDAQQTIYFSNHRVGPNADYTYDALYRLIEATGREHLGQIGGAPIPHSHNDAPRVTLAHPSDGRAMGTYTESYVYDSVGNILEMQHRGSDPASPGWTRRYAYDEPSLIEPAKQSNRLNSTTVSNGNPTTERYVYDAHGNMSRMPHLGGAHPAPNMYWDYRDQLRRTDLGGGGTAYYTYDTTGQRVRKVWEKSADLVEERLYLGGFEIYRRRQGAERLERETLHIMDDQQRLALVETRTRDTAGDDPAPQQLIRYQFGNHLGSASLELDHQAQIVSYEEYTPYGSASYQAVRSQTETTKRYRYTGKERDEESGFYYHGARYYAPWLGRWLSPDPAGAMDTTDLYIYVSNSPVKLIDRTGLKPESVIDRQNLSVLGYGPNEVEETIEATRPKQPFTEAVAKRLGETVSGVVKSLPTLILALLGFPQQEEQVFAAIYGRGGLVETQIRNAEILGQVAQNPELLNEALLSTPPGEAERILGEATVDTFLIVAPLSKAEGLPGKTPALKASLPGRPTPKGPAPITPLAAAETKAAEAAAALSESRLRVQIVEGLEAAIEPAVRTIEAAVGQGNKDLLTSLGLTEKEVVSLLSRDAKYNQTFGRAVELATEGTVRADPFLSQYVEYTANAKTPRGVGKPDWFINTPSSRIPVDLSTAAEAARRQHLLGKHSMKTKSFVEKGLNLKYERSP
jgi:RHS repeat-associated protein